jgi:hypothetical protein
MLIPPMKMKNLLILSMKNLLVLSMKNLLVLSMKNLLILSIKRLKDPARITKSSRRDPHGRRQLTRG